MLRLGLLALAFAILPPQTQRPDPGPAPAFVEAPQGRGVLLLAHGGRAMWNASVLAIAAEVDRHLPVEVAFGMADRWAIESALRRLSEREVREIVAIPLFVSSHSAVLDATRYLLGLRADKPAAVDLFARMAHGGGSEGHAGADARTPVSTHPLDVGMPISMTSALDAHPVVGEIVASRALALSRTPSEEAVILVAHGPDDDEADAKWIANLAVLAAAVRASARFAHVDALTLRDDAAPPVRAEATRRLRQLVAGQAAAGRRVIVVPVLLSFGGIEAGVHERLAELPYEMAGALAPDERLVGWVLAQARR